MHALRRWSFGRVLLVAAGWILLCVLLSVTWIVLQLRGQLAASSGSAGIGAVSMGVSEILLWLVVLPPIVLVLTWLIVRRFGRSAAV